MSHILIIDDDEQSLYLSRYLLEKAGYQVTTTQDGNEALEKIKCQLYDLILIDLYMPTMDGKEIMQKMSKYIADENNQTSQKSLPCPLFIAYSGEKTHTMDGTPIDQTGFDGIIEKTVDIRSFVPNVAKYLASKKN